MTWLKTKIQIWASDNKNLTKTKKKRQKIVIIDDIWIFQSLNEQYYCTLTCKIECSILWYIGAIAFIKILIQKEFQTISLCFGMSFRGPNCWNTKVLIVIHRSWINTDEKPTFSYFFFSEDIQCVFHWTFMKLKAWLSHKKQAIFPKISDFCLSFVSLNPSITLFVIALKQWYSKLQCCAFLVASTFWQFQQFLKSTRSILSEG